MVRTVARLAVGAMVAGAACGGFGRLLGRGDIVLVALIGAAAAAVALAQQTLP